MLDARHPGSLAKAMQQDLVLMKAKPHAHFCVASRRYVADEHGALRDFYTGEVGVVRDDVAHLVRSGADFHEPEAETAEAEEQTGEE